MADSMEPCKMLWDRPLLLYKLYQLFFAHAQREITFPFENLKAHNDSSSKRVLQLSLAFPLYYRAAVPQLSHTVHAYTLPIQVGL